MSGKPQQNGSESDVIERAKKTLALAQTVFPTLAEVNELEIPEKIALIEGLLYPGAWLIVGRPKIGKSWLLLQLALAVAEGGTFLGYNCLRGEAVLAIFAEDDQARVKSRLASLGVAQAPGNIYLIERERIDALAKQYASEYSFREFLSLWLTAHPTVRFAIIDTEVVVRQIWDAQRGPQVEPLRVTESDYQQTRSYDGLALQRQIVIALTNHAAKRKGEWVDIHELINRSNTALAGASGSIALADPPDQDPLDPTQKRRILGVRGRDLKDDVLLAVRQQSDMPYFLSEGPYIEVCQSEAETEILQALEELMPGTGEGTYVTAEDLAAHLSKKRDAVKRAISRMLKKNRTTWRTFRVTAKRGQGGGLRLDPL